MYKPSKILESILQYIVEYKESESLCGDFAETYNYMANKSGKTQAFWWYIVQILKLIPVSVIESLTWSLIMFSNYFKIAFRNILNQKIYSFINISGLAIGIATCIIIFLYLRTELSYDQFHEHKDRIFRLERQYLMPNGEVKGSYNTLAPSFTNLLEKDFPEFEHVVRLYHRQTRVKCDNKSFTENNLFFAEADIFEVFTLPMIKGDPTTALANPFSVILSQSTAYKYFGNQDPIGKNLELLYRVYEVTGIIEDTPEYSHVQFDIIPSYLSLRGFGRSYNIKEDYFLGGDNFSDNVTYTYARIAENANPEILQSKMPDFLDNNLPPITMNDGSVRKASERLNISLRNITNIHIREDGATDIKPTTDSAYITIFTLVAIFILIIACVNFINLSTARGSKRAKEVGLRTAVGASRSSLITQFIGESVFLSFIAILLAIILVALSLPYFENFIGTKIQFNILSDPFILMLLMGIFLTSGFASGIYPAFYLSSFNSASILRGDYTKGGKGTSFRKILVVFQFAISAALIMSLSIIYNQMDFMRNANLGFDKENVLLIPMDQDMHNNYDALKKKLMQNSNIISITASKRAPSSFLGDCPGFEFENNGEVQKSTFSLPHNRVWHDFFKTYKMEIIAGRDISLEYPTDDSLAYILNETACRKLGIENPNEVLGARFRAFGAVEGKVVGVVKDFNYETLKNDIEPIVTYITSYVNTMAIRIAPGNYQETIDFIKNVNSDFNPGATLEYSFLDDRLDALYKNESAMMKLFGYFSMFALIIGCLGLLGLAAFTAEQKTKEIGIRKTLGASIGNITFYLSYHFTVWVLIANFIALPVIYIYMTEWLNNFAYRTNIEISIFLISITISLVIAIVTVGSQTIKVALQNPVKALRTE